MFLDANDGVKQVENVLKSVANETLDTETGTKDVLQQAEKEVTIDSTNDDRLEQVNGTDTAVHGKDWTIVTGKVSPRNSPEKRSGKLKQTSLQDASSSEVSPSRFNLLVNINEEEEKLEEGEISVAEDEKENIKEGEDENSVASEADIQEKLQKLKPAVSQKKRAGHKKNAQTKKYQKSQK
ncbi:hypothetical protein DY000_02062531 [Brassica cretica]|uniref:Uncharacterized protein n=1 Tax=Brassica cretica TaxID=69181 RepID=A0ABQ7AXC1_BRACR|nr:hypothetical protein DY000_02062531 [Brassica cretica]